MTKRNPASLRISSGHYRTADLVLSVVLLMAALLSAYFAIAQGVRDYWLLLMVGLVGSVLMFRRARST